jgi:hypothetical protein
MYPTNKPLSLLVREPLRLYLHTITYRNWKENQLLKLIGSLLKNEGVIEFIHHYHKLSLPSHIISSAQI